MGWLEDRRLLAQMARDLPLPPGGEPSSVEPGRRKRKKREVPAEMLPTQPGPDIVWGFPPPMTKSRTKSMRKWVGRTIRAKPPSDRRARAARKYVADLIANPTRRKIDQARRGCEHELVWVAEIRQVYSNTAPGETIAEIPVGCLQPVKRGLPPRSPVVTEEINEGVVALRKPAERRLCACPCESPDALGTYGSGQ